jgi:hypothetical protein
MLALNSKTRLTAKECLKDSYFDEIRFPINEQPAKNKLYHEVDQTDAYSYETSVSNKYTKKDYMQMLLEFGNKLHVNRINYLKKKYEKISRIDN